MKCAPGCTCKRHSKPTCPPGCQCGLHDPAGRAHPCPPGCTCGRHNGSLKGRKCPPGCQCGHHLRPDLGDHDSYFQVHNRVRAARGKASGHICVRCGSPAKHWAQIHGTDGTDIWGYQPMCVSCHRQYDDSPERRLALSRSWTPERKAALGERTKQMMADGKMGWGLYHRTKVAE